jgi:hypothetical protein
MISLQDGLAPLQSDFTGGAFGYNGSSPMIVEPGSARNGHLLQIPPIFD